MTLRPLATASLLSFFLGCGDKGGGSPADTAGGDTAADADGDGYPAEQDCDDADASVSPGAEEVPYTGIDEDCDPATPDDDVDGDGLALADDCDDADPALGGQ